MISKILYSMIRKENFFFLSVSNISIITYPLHFFNVAILFLDSFIYNCFIVIFVLYKALLWKNDLISTLSHTFVIKKNLSLNFFCFFKCLYIWYICSSSYDCGFVCKSKSIFASRSDFFQKKIIILCNVKSIFFVNVLCMIDSVRFE